MTRSASSQHDAATPGRVAAHQVLKRVRGGATFEAAFDQEAASLPADERRLAHQLAAGVLRWRDQLDGVLAPFTRHGWKRVAAPLKDVLRLGAFQLRHLDRIPPHAAVDTSVALARRIGQARGAGFVNAVLRRLAREAPQHSDDGSLARRFSHPEWLVQRWLGRYGPEGTERLLEWNNRVPQLTIQPFGMGTGQLGQRLTQAGFEWREAPHGAGITPAASRPTELPGFAEGDFYVQDPAQALVVRFAGPAAGGLALDLCAAPGGKSLGLRSSGWKIVAADHRRSRMRRLRESIVRVAADSIHLVQADARQPPFRRADLVLLDAPCSGTGTLARHPDARHRLKPEELERLAALQTTMLDEAAKVVADSGLLLYATCSLEPEENALQIDNFLTRHPEFEREPPESWPDELLSPEGDLSIEPHRHAMDGAYCARLRRR